MKSSLFDRLAFPFFAIVVTVLYYGRFLDNFFTFDDFKYLENMYRSWSDVMIGYGSLRLVSNLVWWPLFQVFGPAPLAYNLLTFLLYMINAVLMYLLMARLLPDRTTPFLAASFFVCGSVGADAILWKATNSSVISLFFCLAALLCYVSSRRTGSRSRYGASLGLFLLAMFSKEEAASLPLLAALVDVTFLGGGRDRKGVLLRVLPFCGIVVLYLCANAFVFNYLLGGHAEPEKLFLFRPLYSIIGGGTSFYLNPDGFIRLNGAVVYVTAACCVLSLFLKEQRRLILFGYLWIFLAFLPQSLTKLGQFEPRVIVNSISRYLYITSIGASVVLAAVLSSLLARIPARFRSTAGALAVLAFVTVHYPRVQSRGAEWRDEGAAVREFISRIKNAVPSFPAPAYVHVVNGPTGRAFIQQSLRAFYGNPDIHWVNDPRNPNEGGSPLFVVFYEVAPEVPIEVVRLR